MKKLDNNGFTLTELLLVVTVIGIFMSMALPKFINAVPKVMANKYKADARILLNDIDRFFEGNKDSPNVFFTPFSEQQDVFLGLTGKVYRNSNGEAVHNTTYPLLLATNRHWVCGSYNPDTDTWEKNETNGYEYKYTDKNNRVVTCQSPGEYFLRCMYEYGADVPASEVKFPTNSDGSKLYVTFEDQTDYLIDKIKRENRTVDSQNEIYSSYKRTCDPIGVLSIRISNPRLKKNNEDYVLYTINIYNWEVERNKSEAQ